MLKGKYVMQYTLVFSFNTVQFICKEIRYQKIWVTRKQLKINPMPVFPSQLTGTKI